MSRKELEDLIDEFSAFLLEQREKNRPLAFYGASVLGRKILSGTKEQNLRVDYFVDRNWKNLPSEVNGVPVISPQKAKQLNCIIFVTSCFFNQILDDVQDDFDCICYYAIGCWILFGKVDEILHLYDSFEDDASRNVFHGLISYFVRSSRRPIVSDYSQYFNPVMGLKGVSTVVDGGAHNGDTIKLFRRKFGEDTRIFAFEPNVKLAHDLNASIQDTDNTTVLWKGLWSRHRWMSFSSGGDMRGGWIDDSGDESIEVVALDDIEEISGVDFIKLDLEGAEPFALKGGRQTIKRDEPNLAICMYHNWEDWITVPALVQEMLPEHRLFLGHHTNTPEETVLYALKPD